MEYNSIVFFIFLTGFLILYFLMPNVKLRQLVILAGNLIFYRFAGLSRLAMILGTSLVVYAASRKMEQVYAGFEKEKQGLTPREQVKILAGYKKRCRKWLWLALAVIVGILVYVKLGRTLGWAEVASARELRPGNILVPLGISYYTFSSVGYLLDIYWRKAVCEHNYLKLLTCMTYFPHIVQGPIGHYDRIMKQFDELPAYENRRVCFGLQLFIWGCFKKLVVADRLVLFTAAVFAAPADFAGVEIFLAVVLGAVQLYADFSGCMDMVCGISQAIGVNLDQNFNHPFFSRSAAEFWRRWHITLGAWFKDYIYMPLAANPRFMQRSMKVRGKLGMRAGQIFSAAVPLLVVWVLTGLWHGTGADYLVWGLYWGLLIISSVVFAPEYKKLNAFFRIRTDSEGFRILQMIRTFFLFCIGRMFTVTGSLHGCLILWQQLFSEHRLWTLFDGSLYNYGLDQKDFYTALAGILLMWAVSILQEHKKIREELAASPLLLRWCVYYGAIVLVLVFGMYGSVYDASSFVYGGF